MIPIEVCERDNIEEPEVPNTTVVTTAASTAVATATTTPPITVDVELRGTGSPRSSLPKGSLSCPTVTATCRPRMWMQQLNEGEKLMNLEGKTSAQGKVTQL